MEKKENGDPRWDMCYFTLNENIGRLNAYLTLPDNVRKFGINIQINGTSDFSGILKVRNIKVTRMTDNSLIVNGSITSNKITTDNIAGTNGWINLRSGLFDYGNGKLKWDGKSLTVAGSGTFAGEITAKSGKIGKYRISSDYLITGSGSTCTEWVEIKHFGQVVMTVIMRRFMLVMMVVYMLLKRIFRELLTLRMVVLGDGR